ncbi:hypothetical protein [Klebsiella pneumoniae]|uniref:hypothetical protein n=1 Tax=Klebsiella pneumoniae TaxID=573 RepID=UPI00200FE1BE|nr:hypothetical protein [Klebsiella pneumoniae]UPY99800.1 hypothetical protein MOV22_26705 [Klebsiella pneumoniae]
MFQTLFPGGEARLVLTEPDDMLATGIEIEARPPGKRVKRLSLLSGGEKSLTALAFLVAIFRARPSPFYVLMFLGYESWLRGFINYNPLDLSWLIKLQCYTLFKTRFL